MEQLTAEAMRVTETQLAGSMLTPWCGFPGSGSEVKHRGGGGGGHGRGVVHGAVSAVAPGGPPFLNL